jgi:hypothetical protein
MDVLLLAANVKTGIDRGDGTVGTYGGGGYTYGDDDASEVLTTATGAGTYQPVAVGNVEAGVAVGVSPAVGTFTVPSVGDVRDGTGYGEDGTEFEGTLVVPDYSSVTASHRGDTGLHDAFRPDRRRRFGSSRRRPATNKAGEGF